MADSPHIKDGFDDDDFFVIGSAKSKKKKSKKHKKIKADIQQTFSPQESILEVSSETLKPDLPVASPRKSTRRSPRKLNLEPALDSDDEFNERIGSITPPPVIDKKLFEAYVSPEALDSQLAQLDPQLEFLDDEVVVVEDEEEMTHTGYQFDDDTEKTRSYLLRVKSKLPKADGEPLDAVLEFATKGTKRFGRIIESIVPYFKSRFCKDSLVLPEYYDPNQVTLIWVEGKTEIRPFYKASTLRIPPTEDVTTISCLLVPINHSRDFLSFYPEFTKSNPHSVLEEIENLAAKEKLEVGDDDLEILTTQSAPPTQPSPPQITQDGGEYFVIGLKGADNKRHEVQVSPTTKINKLLQHYLKVKGIAESSIDKSKVRLIFDDEALDLDTTVGDTELEEDFEVQVVI